MMHVFPQIKRNISNLMRKQYCLNRALLNKLKQKNCNEENSI